MKVEITNGWDGKARSGKECADWEEARQYIMANIRGCGDNKYWRFCQTSDKNKVIVDVGFHNTFVRILGYNPWFKEENK